MYRGIAPWCGTKAARLFEKRDAGNKPRRFLLPLIDVVVLPRRAAWLTALVTRERVSHAPGHILEAGSFGACHSVALPRHRLAELTELGQRHRHHFVDVVP